MTKGRKGTGTAKQKAAHRPKKSAAAGERTSNRTKAGRGRTGARKAASVRAPAGKAKSASRTARKKKAPAAQADAKAPAAPAEATFEPEPPVPVPKTRLSDKQLEEFKQRLLDKRRELIGDMDNLTSEALRHRRSEAAGDLSSMPIHMADIGSDNWEQEFTLGLISNERALLREIDDALLRIADRTYGVCLGTHKPITVARLRAKPWAKYCIEYARLREQGRSS